MNVRIMLHCLAVLSLFAATGASAQSDPNQTTTPAHKADPDSDAAQRALLFLENAVPAGIEPADPMINIRSQAYAVSFARRHGAAAQ